MSRLRHTYSKLDKEVLCTRSSNMGWCCPMGNKPMSISQKKGGRKEQNAMIRKAFKQALGIPVTTSNERFEALGWNNTLDELIEAQRIAQLERPSNSPTGRHILSSLSIHYESRAGAKLDIPPELRGAYTSRHCPRTCTPYTTQNADAQEHRRCKEGFRGLRTGFTWTPLTMTIVTPWP